MKKSKIWISFLGILFVIIGVFFFKSVESSPLYRLDDSVQFLFRAAPFITIAAGIYLIFVGIIVTFFDYKNSTKPIEKKLGKVVDKNKHLCTIEFSDNSRRVVAAKPNVLITIGDEGEFSIQGNWILKYTKSNNS